MNNWLQQTWNFCCSKYQDKLEKITQEIIQKFLSENKIELSCTHAKLCVPIIDRIYKKMCFGIKFSEIKVEGELICDGHHRYVASLLAKFPNMTYEQLKKYIELRLTLHPKSAWSNVGR